MPIKHFADTGETCLAIGRIDPDQKDARNGQATAHDKLAEILVVSNEDPTLANRPVDDLLVG